MEPNRFCSIIPDDLLKKIGDKKSLKATKKFRQLRKDNLEAIILPDTQPHVEIRALYDGNNKLTGGVLLRFDRQEHGATAEGTTMELQMFNVVYDFLHDQVKRESYDNKNAVMRIYKNVGVNFNNAFWDGERFAFGNGDQDTFRTFWIQSVASHEAMHAVTDWVAGLLYIGQSGALNEHMSDVFAICVDHFKANKKIPEADWIIGRGIFMAHVSGKGLRSFKNELAYDDPWIGKDPQGKHMSKYYSGKADNYGVHLNSGIPNHAFYLFCLKTGLESWKLPFEIWYGALNLCRPDEQFDTFAQKTLYVCPDSYKPQLQEAWSEVGILPRERPVFVGPFERLFRWIMSFILGLFGK